MKFLRGVYTLYGVIIFSLLFLIFFLPLLIPVFFKKQFRLTGVFNRWWAKLHFILIGLPFTVEYRQKLDPDRQYIFCPNHFSYLDIITMGLNSHNTIFVGKTLDNIPLFGFMYRNLHITVDRTKLKSRYSTMLKTLEALDEGKSLVIFPEGGIVTEKDPVMARFKDGAFRAAIEKQIPIVPVTIPYNWIILPPDQFLLRWRPLKVIFHEPVDPSGYTLADIDQVKSRVRDIIDSELQQHLTYENRPGTA
ncbi:1-acyl-sn-glycerol-3-phosphate acyltransferase [Fulvivirgaceae bacterium PWU4]|uniref:1-acyl-sn-glycerol-3-phosphate acyltransferase n=1 Tax=Chryseosolibacter histidini TaxID=2782349 RepID=A0AAP2GHP3_9BACT|nr:lysophospholipid acyltransferase family protein [Chryseosolibacter histidini]MBT1696261.1 1-acyl-sn-glycerol-3-phosphate acyltransferase [Chryseosolibacter histidini]